MTVFYNVTALLDYYILPSFFRRCRLIVAKPLSPFKITFNRTNHVENNNNNNNNNNNDNNDKCILQ